MNIEQSWLTPILPIIGIIGFWYTTVRFNTKNVENLKSDFNRRDDNFKDIFKDLKSDFKDLKDDFKLLNVKIDDNLFKQIDKLNGIDMEFKLLKKDIIDNNKKT